MHAVPSCIAPPASPPPSPHTATPIEWKSASKNVTVKVLKKKMRPGQKGTPPTKQTPTESFFNWFTPPPIPENEEEIEEEELEGLQAAMEDDYEVAEIIREKIIDHPYLWFTGEALQDDESSEEDYDSEDDGATPGGETDDESPSDDEVGQGRARPLAGWRPGG